VSALERRYRRLLLAYPAEHRREHGEEMLGVLLDSTPPGRTRPGLRDACDVLRGGLTLRARRANAAGWDDGLALVSLIATTLMCGLVPWGLLMVHFGARGTALPSLAWPLVLLVGLVAPLRGAAPLAGAASAGLILTRPLHGTFPTAPWIALAIIATLATLCSPGPRRGLQILGRGRAALLLAGVGGVGSYVVLASSWGMIHLPRVPGPLDGPTQAELLLVAGVVCVAGAVLRVGTAAARRATVLLAAPLGMVAILLLQLTGRFARRWDTWDDGRVRLVPVRVLFENEPMAASAAGLSALAVAALAARIATRRQGA
jgi:hypothetical protein